MVTSDLSAVVTTSEPYRLSFVVGGLLATEATIAAPLYLELRDWAAVRAALNADNLLHARTRSTAVRITRELIQRLSVLSDVEVTYLVNAPGPDRLHLMWAALWHAELEEARPSTRTKLRTNLFLALRQSGMLADDARLVSPLLSPEVLALLDTRTPSDRRFFPVGGGQ